MPESNVTNHTTLYSRRNQMSPHPNPENLAQIFAQYVRAVVQVVIWATIGFAALAGGYVGLRAVVVGVKIVLKALGV
jgi:hypothetical protein